MEIAQRDHLSTGGGVGLIGMWKAFAEMEELGWLRGKSGQDDCATIKWLRANP